MPYYRNKHILFIHIPKTGGTMFEKLLSKNDKQELFSEWGNRILSSPFDKITLQHQFYSTLLKCKEQLYRYILFDDKIKVISIVRNPYDRIISDLFWVSLIHKESTPIEVYNAIKHFINLHPDKVDNHNSPQYKYLVDENNKLYKNVKIFKLEKLYASNNKINEFLNTKLVIEYKKLKNYNKYLNLDSILLINKHYKIDFEMFNYDMIYNI